MKILKPNLFNELADYKRQSWFEVLPPGITFEDLFDPKLWGNFTGKLKKYDIVRVCAEDGSFDVELTVRAIDVGGIHMQVFPHFRGKSGEAALEAASAAQEESAIKVVPIARDGLPVVRVEYKNATKWRLLGLNGEVERNFESEGDALKAMAVYLDTARLVMPDPEKEEPAPDAAKKPAAKAKAEAA